MKRAIEEELEKAFKALLAQAREVVRGRSWDERKFLAELAETATTAKLVAFERWHHLRATTLRRVGDWKRAIDPPRR